MKRFRMVFAKSTFDLDRDPESTASQACRKYAANFDKFKSKGKGLLLFGNVGTGKSFLAGCIANYLIDSGRTVIMTNFA